MSRDLPGSDGPLRYFVGREDEVERLNVALDRASSDSRTGAITLVSGLRGIGKTALADRFIRGATAGFSRSTVKSVAVDAAHLSDPLKVFTQLGEAIDASNAARRIAEHYKSLFTGPDTAEDERERMGSSFGTMMNDLHGRWPIRRISGLIVVIDDVHTMDTGTSSSDVLKALHARRHLCPIMTLALGAQNASKVLERAGISEVGESIKLPALTRDETLLAFESNLELYRGVSLAEQSLEALARASHGHPNLIRAYVNAAAKRIHARGGGSQALTYQSAFEEVLREGDDECHRIYDGRLNGMSDSIGGDAKTALLPLAREVSKLPQGVAIHTSEAVEMSSLGDFDGRQVVESAVEHGVLVEDDGFVSFGIRPYTSHMIELMRNRPYLGERTPDSVHIIRR